MELSDYRFRKAMVVDDAAIDRMLARKVLSKYSFAEEVLIVESAADALEYLVSEDNYQDLPNVIFLDINMPKMSGFDFLDEYTKLPENIKKKCIIVMLSSSLHPEDRDKALENPYVCQFLNKPLTEHKLKEVGAIS